jgi:hypothetical protein
VITKKLFDAEKLRVELWAEGCAPALRTIREWQAKRIIPSIRIGGRVFFDIDEVRSCLERRNKLRAR